MSADIALASTHNRRLARFAWFVLGYFILVVLWGALVRTTNSGGGCGAHWPLCNGYVNPLHHPRLATIIEFAHRQSTTVATCLTVALTIWTFRATGKGHLARKAALWSVFFLVTEALLGAALVLQGWVEQNDSTGRVIAQADSFHKHHAADGGVDIECGVSGRAPTDWACTPDFYARGVDCGVGNDRNGRNWRARSIGRYAVPVSIAGSGNGRRLRPLCSSAGEDAMAASRGRSRRSMLRCLLRFETGRGFATMGQVERGRHRPAGRPVRTGHRGCAAAGPGLDAVGALAGSGSLLGGSSVIGGRNRVARGFRSSL